jgi:tetratricopeptide (TPR) repeat protein
MKKSVIIFLLFLTCGLFAEPGAILQQAERAYDSKKYPEAISRYEQLISEGYNSYQLYFNLGNAYYRDNKLGKAIYNYERARKLEPNEEDVNINLGIASAKTIDKIDSHENFFISAVKTGLLSTFTTRTWAWLSVASLFLAALFFYLFMSANKILVRRMSFIFVIVFCLGFVLTYFFGYSALSARNNNKFAIITSNEVKIMNEPTDVAKSKFSLHEGTKIRVVESNGDWVLIKLDNGNEGWLRITDVGVI